MGVFRDTHCLPMLFYEWLEVLGKEGVTQATVKEAYVKTFGKAPADGEVGRITYRLMQEARKFEAEAKDKKHKRTLKKSFATGFSNYLAALSSEQLCFLVSDYDPIKARKLYREVDRQDVVEAAKAKISFLAESSHVQYEAVLFGMGGGYKGHGENDNVYDMNEDPKAAVGAMKNLGLM